MLVSCEPEGYLASTMLWMTKLVSKEVNGHEQSQQLLRNRAKTGTLVPWVLELVSLG